MLRVGIQYRFGAPMDQLAAFVINLDSNPERLAATSAQMDSIGLTFTRLPAVDGRRLDNKALCTGAIDTMGRPLAPGEVGCFKSHIKAAEAFLQTDAHLGLVLEDDVAVTLHAMATLQAFCRDWSRQSIWDVANLARPAKRYFTPLRDAVWSGPVPLFQAHYMPVTTSALLWTRGGARAFLMMVQATGMRYPVDVQIQRWIARTDRGLACQPAPFGTRSEISTISTDNSRSSQGLRGHRLRLIRLMHTHFLGAKARLRAQGRLT